MKGSIYSQKGLTLVEVMVAVALLIIYSVMFIMGATDLTRASHELLRFTQSTGFADALAAEIRRGDWAPNERQVVDTIVQADGNINVQYNPIGNIMNITVEPGVPISSSYPVGSPEYAVDGAGCSRDVCRFVYMEPAVINGNNVTFVVTQVIWRQGKSGRYLSEFRLAIMR